MSHIKKHWRKYICIVFFLFLGATTSVRAADPDVIAGSNMSGNLFNTDHEVTNGGSPAYYQLDVTSKTGEEETGMAAAFSTIGSWISGDAVKDEIMAQMYEGINFLVNIAFKANVYMTNAMLTVLDYAFEFDVINTIIDKVEGIMQQVTGISGLKFSGLGLYGQLLSIICVVAGILFVITYFFKRAQIEAVSKIAQVVLILSFTLIFFTNYATILKGANTLTTQLTAVVMGATSGLNNEDGKTGQQSIGDNMWDLFVHRPYLYMQYGTDDASKIGGNRVDTLLAMSPGKDRQTYVEESEVGELKNTMMTYSKVPDRLVFTIMYLVVNGITSIPIFLLGLLIIAFQFWFLVLALLAPIFLLIAAFPGNTGVFRRYIEELTLPLLMKVGVSFIALVIFTMSAIVYEVGNADAICYVAVAVIEFVVLVLIFLIRKRLISILYAGNTAVRMLANEAAKADQRFDDTRRAVGKFAVQAGLAAATGGTSLAATGASGAAASALGSAMSKKDSPNAKAAALANESLNDSDSKAPVDTNIDGEGLDQDLHDDHAMSTESLYAQDPGTDPSSNEAITPAAFLRQRRDKKADQAAAAAVGLAGGTAALGAGKVAQGGASGLTGGNAGSTVAGSTHDTSGSPITNMDHASVPTESLSDSNVFIPPSFLRRRNSAEGEVQPSHSGNVTAAPGMNGSSGQSNVPYIEAGSDSYSSSRGTLENVPISSFGGKGDDASLFASVPEEAPPEAGSAPMTMGRRGTLPTAPLQSNSASHIINTASSNTATYGPTQAPTSGTVTPTVSYDQTQAPIVAPIVGMHTSATMPHAVQALGQSVQSPAAQPTVQAPTQVPAVQPTVQAPTQAPAAQPTVQAPAQPPVEQTPVQEVTTPGETTGSAPDIFTPIIHQSGQREVVEHNSTRSNGTHAKGNNNKGTSNFAPKSEKPKTTKPKEEIKTSKSLPSLGGAGSKDYKPEVHERPDARRAGESTQTVSLNETTNKEGKSDQS